MKRHPLHELAEHSTRARINVAIGPCAPPVDPDEHAECILSEVLRVRLPDLQVAAHRIASLTTADGLAMEGV